MKKLLSIATAAFLMGCVAYAEDAKLTWSDNSDNELGFEIERSQEGGEFATIGSVAEDETTYTDSTVEPGVTYAYRVRAFNHFGYSGYTNEASFAIEDGKYYLPFEEGEDPSGLGGGQVVANLTINAQNVTVNQLAKNE